MIMCPLLQDRSPVRVFCVSVRELLPGMVNLILCVRGCVYFCFLCVHMYYACILIKKIGLGDIIIEKGEKKRNLRKILKKKNWRYCHEAKKRRFIVYKISFFRRFIVYKNFILFFSSLVP